MKTSSEQRRGTERSERSGMELWALSATAGAAFLLLTGAAHAQSATPSADAAAAPDTAASAPQAKKKAEEPKVETIVVTGIRKGIEDAISVKKNSDSIVEAVSAEDIGKLPDVSIAESITRLPGIAAQRVNGRASALSVRGFAPDFSTALLNGREQVSTGDSRFVEFDQYPSELMSGVTVYKTPDAALVGQGLSATVDMQTARPLNFGQRVVAVNYRRMRSGVSTGLPTGEGNRFNFAYIDQYMNRTLGLAFAYARLDETIGTTTTFNPWGLVGGGDWATKGYCRQQDLIFNAQGKATGCSAATYQAPSGVEDFINSGSNTRDAAMVTVQFKPNKHYQSTLDIFATQFDNKSLKQGIQVPLASALPPGGQNFTVGYPTTVTIDGNVVTSGTIHGAKALSRNDADASHDKVYSVGWNNQLDIADWHTGLDLATSNARRTQPHIETTAGIAGNCKLQPDICGDITWSNFNGSTFDLTLPKSLTDTSVNKLTDVMGWGGGTLPQAGYTKTLKTDDTLNAIRLNGKHDLPEGLFFTGVDVGVNYSERTKKREYIEGRLLVGAADDPTAAVDVPGASNLTAPHLGLPFLAWNPDGSVGSIYAVAPKLVPDIVNKNWQVKEKITTTYAKFDIDREIAGISVRGNAGLQIVHTDQSSQAQATDGGNCPGDVCAVKEVAAGSRYNDVLPSLNLVGDFGHGNTLRFGLGRQIARPTLNDMRAVVEVGTDVAKDEYSGSGGNPFLRPFRAWALDVSYEKYFGKQAYISAAGFYKKLDTYILTTQERFDFRPYITAETPPPSDPTQTVGTITRPVNGEGGRIAGLEFAVSAPFRPIHDILDGFGAQANLAMTNSAVTLPKSGFNTSNVNDPTIPMPGLSKRNGSIQLYYEKNGIGARISESYRADFVGSVSNVYGDKTLTYIKGERVVSTQLSYDIPYGPLKGLTVLFQANNLNNAPYIEYTDNPYIEHVTRYGKNFLFGLNYKLGS